MMTSRERLRRCFWHEELDRPGIYCRPGFPPDDPTYDRLKALLAEKSDQKLWFGTQGWIQEVKPAVEVRPHSADYELHIKTVQTPRGPLEQQVMVGINHLPSMEEQPLLKSREDLERYLSLPMPDIAGDAERFFKLERQIGERGIVDVSLGMNPGGFTAALCGSENMAQFSISDRDLLHALCQRRMDIQMALLNKLIEAGVGPYFSMLGEEYIAPPLHGKTDFDDFNLRYDQPLVERVHEAGGRMHIHCHGRIKSVLPSFVAMGVDVLHPFEAPPMGDITAAEAKAVIRGKVCMEGNIQIADMYDCSPQEIRRQTRQLIADVFDDRRGLILCASASPFIWQGGEKCYPQFEAMIDEVYAAAGAAAS